MTTAELKCEVYDIEVFRKMFLYCGYNLNTDTKYQYEISDRKNELDGLIKHLIDREFEFGIGYNCVNYDNQILQYILDCYQMWQTWETDQILLMIYNFSQEVISKTNYELPPPYKERYMDIKQIDLFKIHHYDNKNRRVGLKTLEFSMDLPDIEEMPVDFKAEYLTEEELDMTIIYCWNDVEATKQFWKITTGNTTNELYKGDDKVQSRLDVMDEMGFDHTCLNWSNSKIGDEINKKGYIQETGCKYGDLYDKKKNRKPTPEFTFGDCIPKYIKFKTTEFENFRKTISKERVNMNKGKMEFPFTYNKTTYSVMQGGIHSTEGARMLTADDNILIRDADIGGQYPRTIDKRGLHPSHLGPKWNVMYGKNGAKRNEYKSAGKTDSKKKRLAAMWKECLNAGGYGMTNQKDNWQYDPKVMYTCTIGNQFEVLMLIETLELAGIEVMSANTDGIVCMFPKELNDEYYRICNEWEVIVGNDVIGKLEYSDYSKLIQTSVNDYIAVYTDGKIKTKGDFNVDVELHKNKSKRIVPIALREWYSKGIPVEETVMNHRDIWAFVIGKKASKDYYYQGIDKKTGDVNDYNKQLRYFCSTTGEKLYKIKHENSEKTGPKRSQCESKSIHQTMFNRSFQVNDWKEYHIDYSYYLNEIYKLKDQLEKQSARERKDKLSGQQSLF